MSDMPPPPPRTTPPSFGGYGSPLVATAPLRRIGGLARALVVMLTIFVPLSLLNVVGTVQLAGKAKKFVAGEITADSFRDATRLNIGSVAGYLVVPLAVVTMVWMYRMAANVRSLGRPGLRFPSGWAIGGWFVPPGLIYAVPWLMFRELWKASTPGIAPGDDAWRRESVSPLVNAWWVLYGLVPLLGFFTAVGIIAQFRTSGDDDAALRDVAEQLDRFVGLNVAIALLGTAAAVVYLLLVRQLSERHMLATGEG